ncbi:IS66 family transposase zinc-finger binding domain-containing protein [Shigella flexneri]
MIPRERKATVACGAALPNCGGSLSYLGEDTAEQLELMRSAFRVIRTVRKNMPVLSAIPSCRRLHLRGPSAGYRRTGAAGPRVTSKYAEHTPLYCQSESTAGKVWS